MRTIKTALAVSICIIISKLFNVTTAFYACIAAVISMGNTVSYSYKSGLNRMLGTILGACVGLLFSIIKPEDALLAGLGIVIVIYLCNVFKWKQSITIACTVFCVIMTNLNGRAPFEYSVFRVLDTFLGIVVSIVVNYTVFPPKTHKNIQNSYMELKDFVMEVCGVWIMKPREINLNSLKSKIDQLNADIKAHEEEFSSAKEDIELIEDYKRFLDSVKIVFIYFEMISTMSGSLYLNESNMTRFSSIFGKQNIVSEDKEQLENDENIVYNYNVSKIFGYIENMKV